MAVCGFHILLRRHREPVSRLAWLVVVLVLPFAGALAYLLLGSTSIGRKRIERLKDIWRRFRLCPDCWMGCAGKMIRMCRCCIGRCSRWGIDQPLSRGRRQHAELMADPDSGMDQMAADIDAATDHVHILFYIWLTDHNGTKIIDAAMACAAARGVTCRALVDATACAR